VLPVFSVDHLNSRYAAAEGGPKISELFFYTSNIGLNLQPGRPPVWFDLDLLEMVHLLRLNNPRITMDSLVHALYQKQNLRGHTAFSSEESTRRQLGKAVEEFGNILFLVSEKIRKVSEEDSLIACCPSCIGTTGPACLAIDCHPE